jgi:hypothetical protein
MAEQNFRAGRGDAGSKKDADDEIDNDHQNQYGVHDEVDSHVGFVFLVQFFQSFQHW